MRAALRVLVLAAALAAGVAAGGVVALAQSGAGVGSSGTSTVGPGTIVTATSTTPTPAGPPRGTAAEQTHPSVLPRTGRAHTRFTARLTLADAPGHSGVLATDYRLQLTAPRNRVARRCSPPTPPTIDSGSAHEVVRTALAAPVAGWCTGRYALTVFLQRGPYCPAPSPGQPPRPCPEFATQEVNVGYATFVVTGQPPRASQSACRTPTHARAAMEAARPVGCG